MIKYDPSKSPPHLKKMNHICALEAGRPVRISLLAGANSTPEWIWNKESDEFCDNHKGNGSPWDAETSPRRCNLLITRKPFLQKRS